MAIQLSRTSYSNIDIERKILSNFDLKTALQKCQVCQLWNRIISDDQFLRPKTPELSILCERNIKQCLNEYAVDSEEAILYRFEKLINKIEPFGSFSFSCVFPHNPDNILSIKRQPYIFNNNNRRVGVDDNYLFQHEDFCILMTPIPEKKHSLLQKTPYTDPHCLKINITGNFSIVDTVYYANKFCHDAEDIIFKSNYPLTAPIRNAIYERAKDGSLFIGPIMGILALFALFGGDSSAIDWDIGSY